MRRFADRQKGGYVMADKERNRPFNGAAWFDRQVQRRTRAALNARGSKAKTKSPEYVTEYERQLKLFRAERAEIKKRKKEKHLARLAEQQRTERFGA